MRLRKNSSSGRTATSRSSGDVSAYDRTRTVRSDRPLRACLMKCAMQQAVRWRLLLENPDDGLKVPQQVRNEMRSLTVEQSRALLKAAEGTKYGPVLAVALTTGMRPSEYMGLKWQDINWARQTVSIVRSIRRLNGKWCFSDTNRSRSRRPIKLQNRIVSLLHDLHTKVSAQDLYPEARDLIFRTPSGQPISADYRELSAKLHNRPQSMGI